MTELLRQWVTALTAAGLFCAIASAVTPEGWIKGVVRLCCAAAMAVALLAPLGRAELDGYALSAAKYREAMQAALQRGEEAADRLSRTIIESEYAAYISDKGAGMGLPEFSVRVLAKWGDEVWYPYEVWLDCRPSEELAGTIEGELGIPRERIHWRDEDGKTDVGP